MITSEKQYEVTQRELNKFYVALVEVKELKAADWLREVMTRAIESQINDLELEISEYEKCRGS